MFKFLKEKIKNAVKRFSEKAAEEGKTLRNKVSGAPKTREFSSEEEIKQELKEEIVELEEKELKVDQKIEKIEEKKEQAEKKEGKELEKKEEKLEEEIEELKEEKKSLFSKLKEKFSTTKITEESFESLFEQVELILLENSVAVSVINELKEKLKWEIIDRPIKRNEIEREVKNILRKALEKILLEPFDFISKVKEKKPFIIAFFGINGSGKTTTIAKISNLLKKNGISSVLAAADTFRAASIEQLEKHASRLKVKVIKHDYGADPAAVAFDAIAYAKAHGIDAVLIDTAGRMHTKTDLMKEMEKICRVAKPDLKIFVGESITGNDAVEQAHAFNESAGIDAIILAKADIDEKGGAIISTSFITKKPILFLGTGQNYDDLEFFDKKKVLDKLGL